MTDSTANWVDFWKEEKIFTPEDWSKSLEVFTRSLGLILTFIPEDKVLDVGCGPGCFASFLAGKVKEFDGLDVSERYVQTCREMFWDRPGLSLSHARERLPRLLISRQWRFRQSRLLSVVQYYRNQDELLRLIDEVLKLMNRGSQFLIGTSR